LKIILDDQVTEKAVRADLAWELFFRSKTAMPKGHGEPLLPFANWLWDELGKRAGPEAATQLIADRGEMLRILDMEVWHQRARDSKDIIVNPDFKEVIMSGQGWAAIVPEESLITPEDFWYHYDEGYRRTKDGGWVPSKNRGHRKVREK
jgi:hypothetical protein